MIKRMFGSCGFPPNDQNHVWRFSPFIGGKLERIAARQILWAHNSMVHRREWSKTMYFSEKYVYFQNICLQFDIFMTQGLSNLKYLGSKVTYSSNFWHNCPSYVNKTFGRCPPWNIEMSSDANDFNFTITKKKENPINHRWKWFSWRTKAKIF